MVFMAKKLQKRSAPVHSGGRSGAAVAPPSEILDTLERLDLATVGDASDVRLPPDIEFWLTCVPTKRDMYLREGKSNGLWSREIIRRLVVAYCVGAPDKLAADFAGVSTRVLYYWAKRSHEAAEAIEGAGLDPHSPDDVEAAAACGAVTRSEADMVYVGRLMTRAKAYTKLAAVQAWKRGFHDDWRAAAEYLARVDPGEFGRRDTVQHQHQHAVVLLPPVGDIAAFTREGGPGSQHLAPREPVEQLGPGEYSEEA